VSRGYLLTGAGRFLDPYRKALVLYPIAARLAAVVTDSSRTMNAPDGEPQVIVVADDDKGVRELIQFRLTRAGKRVQAG
jgi:hypothetical protein